MGDTTLRVQVAGRVLEQEFETFPSLAEIEWDGLNDSANRTSGLSEAQIEFLYECEGLLVTSNDTRQMFVFPRGNMLADGWTVSSHHYLAPGDLRVLHKGSGERIENPADAALVNGEYLFVEDNRVAYYFNTVGRHLRTIDLDTRVVLLSFSYDAQGRLTSIVDRFGNQTAIQRDANGVPTAILSPDGLSTQLTVDTTNPLSPHLTSLVLPDSGTYGFEYTSQGLMTAEVEPAGNRFEHTFDSHGRLSSVEDEEGGSWTFTRTDLSSGDKTFEMVTAEGDTTSYLDQVDSADVYSSTITDPSGAVTLYSRSADDLTVNKSLPCGMMETFVYANDPKYGTRYIREETERTPSNKTRYTLVTRTYQDQNADQVPDLITEVTKLNNKSTTWKNDTLLSRITLSSPLNRTVVIPYNATNLLPTSLQVSGLYDENYGYDSRGRLTSVSAGSRQMTRTYNTEGFLGTVTDAASRTTTYSYDGVGRVTRMDRPDTSSVQFTYDENGNLTVLETPAGIEHGFGYSAVNANTSYQTPLSGSYGYVYDLDRRLTAVNFPSGRQIVNVYSQGRLAQTQTPEGNTDFSYLCGSKLGSMSRGTEAISYGYDGALLTSETLAGTVSQVLTYGYNTNYDPTSFTYAGGSVSLSYDNDRLMTGSGRFAIVRNTGNGLPYRVQGAGLVRDRTFSGYAEVDAETFKVSNVVRASWSLGRDNTGRITTKTETVGGVTANYAYGYDPLGRLESVTKDGILVEEYEYGPNGARSYETNTLRGITGRAYTCTDEDHLIEAGDVSYAYDEDGFLESKTVGLAETTYTYSSRGELLSAALPGGTLIEYVYDALGRRVAKKVNLVTVEKYLWQDLTRLLAVYDGSDQLTRRFEYADARTPVAMTVGTTTYFLVWDQVGTLRALVNTSGATVKRVDYDTFGNILADTNPALTVPFGFAGGLHDRDTGLVKFGYRDYDPGPGRWTAKDPILFAGGDTDLYGYCLSDPVNWVDPGGLFWGAVFKGTQKGILSGGVGAMSGTIIGGGLGGMAGALTGIPGMGFVGGVVGGYVGGRIGGMFDDECAGLLNCGEESMTEKQDATPCP